MLQPDYPSLRPLSTGELMDRTFAVYRQEWRRLLCWGLVNSLPYTIFTYLSTKASHTQAESIGQQLLLALRQQVGGYQGAVDQVSAYILYGLGLFLIYPLTQGVIIIISGAAVLGRDQSSTGALRTALRRYIPLLGTHLLLVALLPVAMVALALAGLVVMFPITIPFGLVALYTMISLTGPVVLMERHSLFRAMGRSWRLVTGRFWSLLGLGIAFYLLQFSLNLMFGSTLLLPTQLLSQFILLGESSRWLVAITAGLGTAILMPILVIGRTLAYFDTRVRQEGLDIALITDGETGLVGL